MIVRDAYDGFVALSALWHSSRVYGPQVSDAPVYTPLMEILDHFMLALGGGRVVGDLSLSAQERMLLICGAATWRAEGVVVCIPVTIRLPLADYRAAASCICVGEILLNFLFRRSQISSGLGWPSGASSRLARSTTRLGLAGLNPVTSE
jgi:hypothetical protein